MPTNPVILSGPEVTKAQLHIQLKRGRVHYENWSKGVFDRLLRHINNGNVVAIFYAGIPPLIRKNRIVLKLKFVTDSGEELCLCEESKAFKITSGLTKLTNYRLYQGIGMKIAGDEKPQTTLARCIEEKLGFGGDDIVVHPGETHLFRKTSKTKLLRSADDQENQVCPYIGCYYEEDGYQFTAVLVNKELFNADGYFKIRNNGKVSILRWRKWVK